MTSLYPIRQRTGPAKPKPRRRYGRKSRRKNGEATPPPAEPPSTPLSALGESLIERFQCLSAVQDDSIEVHFLDGFLDSDQPLMQALFSSTNKPSDDLNTSGFTDDTTAANTSADDSILSYPENNGTFGPCLNGEFPAITLVTGSHNDILEDDQEDETGGGNVPDVADAKKHNNGGWMPSAISNMWDNVVSSNFQCWQGTPADLSPEPTFKSTAAGTVKDKNYTSTKSTEQESKKLPKDSSYFLDCLQCKMSFVDEKNEDSLAAMSPLESSRASSSYDEPIVGRQLFGMEDKNVKHSFADDSESTALTCNFSASPYTSGIPMSMTDDYFQFLSDSEDGNR